MELLNAVWEKLRTSASKWLFHNRRLNEEMEVLLKKTEAMKSLQEDVTIALESLERRHKKKRKREVDIWLREVQRKKVEIEKREQEVRESMDILQWRLRRLVRKDIREVNQLSEQGKFPEGVSIFHEPEGEVQHDNEAIQGSVQAGPSMPSTFHDQYRTSEELSEEDSLEYILEEKDVSKRDRPHKGLLIETDSEAVAQGVSEDPIKIPHSAAKWRAQLEPEEVEGARKKEEDKRRYAFKTKSEVDIMDDGFKWRKYGKKSVKNSLNPRNYYRCSFEGCPVKKRVERDREDPSYVITTYEGSHKHPMPIGVANELESISVSGLPEQVMPGSEF